MKYLITKASCDYEDYYEILEVSELDVEAVYNSLGDFIVMHNDWYGEDIEDISYFFRISREKAKQISECKLEITIYDDYIE